jgi:glycosyltransferase involved in cell wall biosynthesis
VQNIRLIGWLDKKELIKYLQVTDVFVHPNNKSEGTPNALIEVQGVGIPIVGFDIEGVRDIITDGVNGYLEHSKSMKKFGEKIISLAKRKNLIAKMKENARKNYETNFNPIKIKEIYEKAYESLYP